MSSHRPIRVRQAPAFKHSRECFESVCDRLKFYAKDITKDYVVAVSDVLEDFKSLLPDAEVRAEMQWKKTTDDFIEDGRKYKAGMKK